MSVDPNIRQQVMEILSNPMDLPPEFWGYDVQNWMKEAPVFPISQVFGFTQFAAQTSTKIVTTETTISNTYADIATVGPTLSNLPDGQYLILVGCQIKNSTNGSGTFMSYQVNSTAASDNDAVITDGTNFNSLQTASVKSLSNNGSNTLTAKYRVGANTGSFAYRFIVAFKFANL